MKGFRAGPAVTIDFEDTDYLPMRSIGDQYLDRFFAILPIPQDHQPYAMIDVGNLEGLGEIPPGRARQAGSHRESR
jgi:hypothetical protein